MGGFSRHPGPPGRWLSLAPVPLCSQPALAVLWLCWGSWRRRLQGGAAWGAPAVAAVLGMGCARAGLCSPGTPLKEGAREPSSPRLPPSLFSMAVGCPELDEV